MKYIVFYILCVATCIFLLLLATGCKSTRSSWDTQDETWDEIPFEKVKKRDRKPFPFLTLTYKELFSGDVLDYQLSQTIKPCDGGNISATHIGVDIKHSKHIYLKSAKGDSLKYDFAYIRKSSSYTFIDSAVMFLILPYGLTKVYQGGGIDITAQVNDTIPVRFLANKLILERREPWKSRWESFTFRELVPRDGIYRRFMYVHDIGFIWEEIITKDKIYRWELMAMDHQPIDDYLKQHPEFTFFLKL